MSEAAKRENEAKLRFHLNEARKERDQEKTRADFHENKSEALEGAYKNCIELLREALEKLEISSPYTERYFINKVKAIMTGDITSKEGE